MRCLCFAFDGLITLLFENGDFGVQLPFLFCTDIRLRRKHSFGDFNYLFPPIACFVPFGE